MPPPFRQPSYALLLRLINTPARATLRSSPETAGVFAADVRFASLADILTSPRHVRFISNNGAVSSLKTADGRESPGYKSPRPISFQPSWGKVEARLQSSIDDHRHLLLHQLHDVIAPLFHG
jgi:hypothetical protein